MSVSNSRFTVAKLDAGMAILLTSDHHLIEFPSLLLPSGVAAGSIIDLSVAQNSSKEKEEQDAFVALQRDIRNLFAVHEPSTPKLTVRNTTQTSVVLEWNLLDLATADMRSLSLYKNGAKLGKIPNATTTTTKLSGLALDTEYSFHLVLKTSAGTFTSNVLKVKTHKMTNLTGLNVCLSNIRPEERQRVAEVLERVGAKPPHEKVRIDTTHFVTNRGMGDEFKKAQTMNIPIVVPDFVEACEAEGRLMRVGSYYLDSDPALRPKRTVAPVVAAASTTSAEPAERSAAEVPQVAAVTVDAVLPPSTTPLSEEETTFADDAEVAADAPSAATGTNGQDTTTTVDKIVVDAAKSIKEAGLQGLQKVADLLPTNEGEGLKSIAEAAPAEESAHAKQMDDGGVDALAKREIEPHPAAAESVEDLPAQIQGTKVGGGVQEAAADRFPASMGRNDTEGMEDVAL